MAAETPQKGASDGRHNAPDDADADKTVVDPVAQERLRAAEMFDPEKTVIDASAQAKLRAAGFDAMADSDKTVVSPMPHVQVAGDDRTIPDPYSLVNSASVAADNDKTLVNDTGRFATTTSSPTVTRMQFGADQDKTLSGYLPLPAAASLALPVGFKLYEYQILSVLGQGGFGITYLAKDINLNVRVAM